MKISELFQKDIYRNINGVIKVGQQDKDNVRQELEEYVVTKELDKHFRTFFERYTEALHNPTDKMGVWISGFFGSGKSHFLKILSYLLANQQMGEKRALDYFDDVRIPDAMLRAIIAQAANNSGDVILFNIDSKAEASSKNEKESIVKVFQKVFDEYLGYFGTVPAIAEFERQLDKQGKYEAFQQAFLAESGLEWKENRDAWGFYQDAVINALQTSTGMSAEAATKLFDVNEQNYSLSVDRFAKQNLEILDHWRNFASREPNPDEFIYRRLLLAQCNALAEGIPALFDKTKNYQALFLPGNLLNQDSILRRLVKEIPESDWQDIEVVGWLYQFYISERKDEVIGAKSKVEAVDIPAATQLFTPRWIVQYMVENSLGRLWLESHPESNLREKMPYYLEAQGAGDKGDNLEDKRSLTPQELTVIDPACGSGHILVYTFDLLFEIYKEQGYLERDIPALILTHNLHGLDIDERAAQLASFAVLMKARAKNSRILRKPVALNITVVRPTHGQTLPLADELNGKDWQGLIEAFKNAENLGSLITPPIFDAENLNRQLNDLEASSSVFRESVTGLRGLLLQAKLLRNKYWVVVANPPFMGGKRINLNLKEFLTAYYNEMKSDLFSVFIMRNFELALPQAQLGFVSPFVWMFLSSYEKLRELLISKKTIYSLVKPSYTSFFDSAIVPLVTFVIKNTFEDIKGIYVDLGYLGSAESQPIKLLEAIKNPNCGYLYYAKSADFGKIPGSAIAYWVSEQLLEAFTTKTLLGKKYPVKIGMRTGDNNRFLRKWFEVSLEESKLNISNSIEALK